jgi:lycopene cyclase domain-containing protein
VSYTVACLVAVAAAVLLDVLVLRTRLVRRKAFWTAYAICLIFQLVVNGILTGRRLVTYAPDAIVGWRVAHAPVEDLAFGFSLVLQALAWWVWWGRRLRHARTSPGTATATRRALPTATRRSSTE